VSFVETIAASFKEVRAGTVFEYGNSVFIAAQVKAAGDLFYIYTASKVLKEAPDTAIKIYIGSDAYENS
jgi:hypothetical protein